MKQRAAQFWAKYFGSSSKEALELNHMTVDCMRKFAESELKRFTYWSWDQPGEIFTSPDNLLREYLKNKDKKPQP